MSRSMGKGARKSALVHLGVDLVEVGLAHHSGAPLARSVLALRHALQPLH